ncbi:MAG: endonuclease V [Thermodesulfobacteriota bacterium]
MALQETLQGQVRLIPLPHAPRFVAGADAICDRADQNIFGAMVVFSYPELELVEEAGAAGVCPFPYRTGLLSFREAPILAEAYERLKQRPDVILVDGQGIAHPRGLGLATHLGLALEIPTIGVAKSRLVGKGEEPSPDAGSANPLIYQGKEVGLILRTKKGRKPFYLSPGHRITLAESREIVMGCVQRYRSPEPLRQADRLSRRLRSGDLNRQGGPCATLRGNRR